MLHHTMKSNLGRLGAGILGLRNASKPDKLKGAFVWAIVGAVAAGLSGRMITMALLIVSTFFISKVRKSGTNASQPPYAQAAYGYTPQPAYDQAGYYGYTNQPAYQQPQSQQAVYTQPAYDQQPYAQPAPAYAPVVDQQFYAPATAGQPEQPEQPLQAEPAQPAEESENKGR